MQEDKTQYIDSLRYMLSAYGYTEKAPFHIAPTIILRFRFDVPEAESVIGKVHAEYIYLKGDVPFVANSKHDEVAAECLFDEDVKSLIRTMKMYEIQRN